MKSHEIAKTLSKTKSSNIAAQIVLVVLFLDSILQEKEFYGSSKKLVAFLGRLLKNGIIEIRSAFQEQFSHLPEDSQKTMKISAFLIVLLEIFISSVFSVYALTVLGLIFYSVITNNAINLLQIISGLGFVAFLFFSC